MRALIAPEHPPAARCAPPPALRRALLGALALALAALAPTGALGDEAGLHPQDGPHTDLRIAVEPDGVRFAAGLNLAFLDEALDVPRESLDSVADVEVPAIEAALRDYFREKVVVAIDGVPVTPVIESFQFFNDPEPGMMGIFPRFGARALMRGAIIARYKALAQPQTVAITWPTYPPDLLAVELEGTTGPDGGPPAMVIEAQIQALGELEIIRFSEAKPTVTWYADEGGEARYQDVPPPPTPKPPATVSALGLALVLASLAGAGAAVLRLGPRRGLVAGAAMASFALAAALTLGPVAPVAIPGTGGGAPPVTPERARAIFEPLHANMYRAFDYTDEGDIYDALERSVDGPLLAELYDQIYTSLVQAEQGGMLGIVTGVEPLETTLADTPTSTPTSTDGPPTIGLTHRWRVSGTVYHFGHSHTRVHEYQADYTLAAREGSWRIVGHRLRSQRRLDDGGQPMGDAPLPEEL